MKQTTLTKNPPRILDATCSFFRVWPKHATIRIDIRPEVKPDIVGDIKKTNFPGHCFDEIYLDPPHMIREDNPEYAYARHVYRPVLIVDDILCESLLACHGFFRSQKRQWLDQVMRKIHDLNTDPDRSIIKKIYNLLIWIEKNYDKCFKIFQKVQKMRNERSGRESSTTNVPSYAAYGG